MTNESVAKHVHEVQFHILNREYLTKERQIDRERERERERESREDYSRACNAV